jgi:hypothetical protein
MFYVHSEHMTILVFPRSELETRGTRSSMTMFLDGLQWLSRQRMWVALVAELPSMDIYHVVVR